MRERQALKTELYGAQVLNKFSMLIEKLLETKRLIKETVLKLS